MTTCTHCGAENLDTANTCAKCSKDLTESDVPPPTKVGRFRQLAAGFNFAQMLFGVWTVVRGGCQVAQPAGPGSAAWFAWGNLAFGVLLVFVSWYNRKQLLDTKVVGAPVPLLVLNAPLVFGAAFLSVKAPPMLPILCMFGGGPSLLAVLAFILQRR